MNNVVYADNAATTPIDKKAFEVMSTWLLDDFGNASQPYSFSRKPKQALAEARAKIALCIGAFPEEIYFTSGGTESDNWVIKSSAFSDSDKRTTITSSFEHHAVLNSCASIERLGYPVVYTNPTKEGIVTPEILKRHITNETRLVSVMYANNELGSIQPIKELSSVAHTYGALFHTDAVQAVGHIKIDVRKLGVDFLSASAHKFNGPKGVGFLYIRQGVELSPYVDGGSQENAHRAGTENIPSIVGMATALFENYVHLDENAKKINELEDIFIREMKDSEIPFLRNGGTTILPGLLSLSFEGKDGEAILHRLDLLGISVSTGSACDSVKSEISHVLKSINLDESKAKGTIRISLGKYNTVNDVKKIVAALKRILK